MPEEMACYTHALEIAYGVPRAACTQVCPNVACTPVHVCSLDCGICAISKRSQDCESHLKPYVADVKQEIETLKSRQTASERLKSFIREHCLKCHHRPDCSVPHVAAG